MQEREKSSAPPTLLPLLLLLSLLLVLVFVPCYWQGSCHCKSSHEHQGQKEGSAPENRQRSSLEVAAAVAAAGVASSAAAAVAAAVVAAGGAAAVVTANVPMHNPRSKVCARSCHNGADNVGPTTL
jgi:hypothetical protein